MREELSYEDRVEFWRAVGGEREDDDDTNNNNNNKNSNNNNNGDGGGGDDLAWIKEVLGVDGPARGSSPHEPSTSDMR